MSAPLSPAASAASAASAAVSAAISSPPASPPPASFEVRTAFGRHAQGRSDTRQMMGVSIVRPDKVRTASPQPSQRDAAAATPRQEPDLLSWSDPLLELVLDHQDLAHSGQADRRGQSGIHAPQEQAMTLVRAFPHWYKAAPDPASVRQLLEHWCERLPLDSKGREKLLARMHSDLSPEAAFYTLAQVRASTVRLAAPDTEAVCCGGSAVGGLICSPDSRCLALWSHGRSVSLYVNIWQQEAGGVRRLGGSCHDDSELSCMVFGADSRSLRCLGRWGEISQWQRRATAEGDQWQKTDSFQPCREFVTQATLSPDGRYMAALLGVERASEGEVQIFRETAPDVWQQQGRWPCRSRPGARRRYDETPLHSPLLFSSQARHLFFADGRGLRAFCRNGDSWQELRLESDRSADGGPADGRWDHYTLAVDAGEHRLAAAQLREEDIKDEMAEPWHDVAYLRVHQLLQVWHFEEGHGWRHVAKSRNMDGDSFRGSFAMTFSPDGQQLVFKESVGLARRLCILSAMAPGSEPVATRLRPGAPDIQASNDSYSPDFLQFSTTGRQLATCAFNGVQIWQKGTGFTGLEFCALAVKGGLRCLWPGPVTRWLPLCIVCRRWQGERLGLRERPVPEKSGMAGKQGRGCPEIHARWRQPCCGLAWSHDGL